MHFRTFQGSLVREGEVGGWIESNKNLSQSKFSWVFDEGKVYSSEDVLFISYNFSKRGLTFLKHEKMKYV